MLSDRFYHIIGFMCKLGKLLNVHVFCYCSNTRLLYCDPNPFRYLTLLANYLLVLLWLILNCVQIFGRYREHQIGIMNLSLAILFGALPLFFGLHLQVTSPKQVCQILNGVIILNRYLHRKLIQVYLNPSFSLLNI